MELLQHLYSYHSVLAIFMLSSTQLTAMHMNQQDPPYTDVRILIQQENAAAAANSSAPIERIRGEEACGKYSRPGVLVLREERVEPSGNRLLIYEDDGYRRYAENFPFDDPSALWQRRRGVYTIVLATPAYRLIGRINVYVRERDGIISGLFVDHEFRRHGHARQLLAEVYNAMLRHEGVVEAILDVHNGATNQPAIRLYEGEGFVHDERNEGYVMRRNMRRNREQLTIPQTQMRGLLPLASSMHN